MKPMHKISKSLLITLALPLLLAGCANRSDGIKPPALPDAARYAVFDAAVNSGVRQSAKWLQQALGVNQDGVIGKQTLAAAQLYDGRELAAKMLGARLQFMTNIPSWPTFGKGWARRIAALLSEV